jgi:hypothetical protein
MRKYMINIISALLLTYSGIAQSQIDKDKLNIIEKNQKEYAVFGKDTIPLEKIIHHKMNEKLTQTDKGYIFTQNHSVKHLSDNNDTIFFSFGTYREIKPKLKLNYK